MTVHCCFPSRPRGRRGGNLKKKSLLRLQYPLHSVCWVWCLFGGILHSNTVNEYRESHQEAHQHTSLCGSSYVCECTDSYYCLYIHIKRNIKNVQVLNFFNDRRWSGKVCGFGLVCPSEFTHLLQTRVLGSFIKRHLMQECTVQQIWPMHRDVWNPADTDVEAVNQSQTIITEYKLSIYLIPSDTFILTSDNTRPPTVWSRDLEDQTLRWPTAVEPMYKLTCVYRYVRQAWYISGFNHTVQCAKLCRAC